MFDFEFDKIKDGLPESGFENGAFLWVFHANKVPPHIGISINGKFYSLKSNGTDKRLDTKKIESLIKSKEIGSFIIELKPIIKGGVLDEIFEFYSQTKAGETTCLTPIKDLFQLPESNKLSELLASLKHQNKLGTAYRFNLAESVTGIRKYESTDVLNRLIQLEKQDQ